MIKNEASHRKANINIENTNFLNRRYCTPYQSHWKLHFPHFDTSDARRKQRTQLFDDISGDGIWCHIFLPHHRVFDTIMRHRLRSRARDGLMEPYQGCDRQTFENFSRTLTPPVFWQWESAQKRSLPDPTSTRQDFWLPEPIETVSCHFVLSRRMILFIFLLREKPANTFNL